MINNLENNSEYEVNEINTIIKRKKSVNYEEENECEQLIKIHQNNKECSLMIEGYHINKKKFYFCVCDPDCQNPLCYGCLNKCHFNHWKKLNKTIENLLTDIRNCVCNCGLKNHFVNELEYNSNFIYEEQCQFLEWSITTKNYYYYEDENNPDEVLCMLCYYIKGNPSGFIKKSDELLCRRLKCCNKYPDYLSIFKTIKSVVSVVPFFFEKFSEIQFLNMIMKSFTSFENGFHKINITLNILKDLILTKNKPKIDFNYFVNNTPFIKAIENISQILDICHSNYYAYQIIDFSTFIFPILKKKFDFKSQSTIWILKKYLFDLYHKLNFRKDYEKLPILSTYDIINLNPFQRIMYRNYINIFPEFDEKYFKLNDEGNNYIDNILLIIEKYNKIKYKDENAYEIIRKLYAECKIIIRHNKFSYEQNLKFFSLIDDIILDVIESKNISSLRIGYEEMRMLSQMIKCILFTAYNYNDDMLIQYLNNEIPPQKVCFFHSKNEIAKKIYRNCSHILLICKNLHESYVVNKKAEIDITNEIDELNANEIEKISTTLRNKINKLENKIIYISNEIISLTLNNPDAYMFGLEKILKGEKKIYLNYINNIFSEKENTIYDEMKEMCIHLEDIYYQYFLFEITADEVEEEVIEKIDEFFRIINKFDFVPPFDLLNEERKSSVKIRPSLFKNLIEKMKKNNKENQVHNDNDIKYLINKIPLVFILNKSLEIILKGNSSNQNHTKYINRLLKFYGYFLDNNSDNCIMFLNSKMLRTIKIINIEYIPGFINLLHYITNILKKNDAYFSHIKDLMRVLDELVKKVSGKTKYISSFEKILKIIHRLSKFKYLHQDQAINRIRKTIKTMFFQIDLFKKFKDTFLIPHLIDIDENTNKYNNKTLAELFQESAVFEGYYIEDITNLFTKYLKIINFLFDGNSTLNEIEFLNKIFEQSQIPQILREISLYLPLRIEIIKFYRITYIDVIIQSSKINEYISLIAHDVKVNEVDLDFSNFIFFQSLLLVKDKELDLHIDCNLLNYELQNFSEIIQKSDGIDKNYILKYFEESIVLPLYVFINKYISIIYNLDGNEYIKLYEIIFNFLETKKYIIEEGLKYEKKIEESIKTENNIFKTFVFANNKNKFSLLMKKINKDDLKELNNDLLKLQDPLKIEILNYLSLYNYFQKHVNTFVEIEGLKDLQDKYKKGGKNLLIEEMKEKIEELKNKGEITNEFSEKVYMAILKYENSKLNYFESSLSQNLSEKNITFNISYRAILLRQMFYLINNENLYLKYKKQNLWHIFRLLQFDTAGTQDDLYKLRKVEVEKNKKKFYENIINNMNNINNRNMNNIYNNNNSIDNINSDNSPSNIISQDKNKTNDSFMEIFNKNNNHSSSSLISVKMNEKRMIENSNTSLIIVQNPDNSNEYLIKANLINIHYFINLFFENFLSIIFQRCNPSPYLKYDDYIIAFTIIKILKYLCEEHNINFQTLFFKNILIEIKDERLNVFDLMMSVLDKILLITKWKEVNFETNESLITYYYDIFFCIMEFSIEMIQGTSKENLLLILNNANKRDEKSYFIRFLLSAKNILKNNLNNSETIYKVRLDIMNFITAFIEERNTPIQLISLIENIFNPIMIFDSIVATLKKLYLRLNTKNEKFYNEFEFDNEKSDLFINNYFSDSEFSKNIEFELANRMYYYAKQLVFFDNKDVIKIIEAQKKYTPKRIIELKKKRDNNENDLLEDSESVFVESRFYQHYFAVKFFEAITREIWIKGSDKKHTKVLFTLDPSVFFLSENTKFEFIKNVPRDSRSSKLFTLLEYTEYFIMEINQNKKKINKNCFIKLLGIINLTYVDFFIFIITAFINIMIFYFSDDSDKIDQSHRLWKIVFPVSIIQFWIVVVSIVFWFITKFKLYYLIEKKKYFHKYHLKKEIPLTFWNQLYIIFIKTIFSKREIMDFTWDLIFNTLGLINPYFLFVYSIQLLKIVNISSTLQNITKAIIMRYYQFITLIIFLIIEIYIFSTIAFFLFSKDYIKTLEENQENACGSLFYCFLTHIEFGLRTDGGIGEFIKKTSFLDKPSYFMGMFFFQFLFYLLTIVIMLNFVGGSVIDTFAELREKSQEDLNDMENVCFICNGTRNDIEKKGEVFEEHIKNVHSVWTYLDYIIGLSFVDPQETNAINSYVIEQLNEKKISWFPSFVENDDNHDNDNNNELNEDEENEK